MIDNHITSHPILVIPERIPIDFYWNDEPFTSFEGEPISSALLANGIRVFGHHHKDGAPLGIFCANGQCAQCMVVADNKPVKACVEPIRHGMKIFPMDGLPRLPQVDTHHMTFDPQEVSTPVLIIGGGPAGLSAAIELAGQGIPTLLVDDKPRLGGKLVLQTHRFFGSTEAVYAGTRGIDIAARLEQQTRSMEPITIWTQSTAIAVYSDKRVGVMRGDDYVLVTPEIILIATGAREKSLAFPGNTLPGVYGAGAFQTLVNRDLVRPAKKVFIVGGGNVGLIAGYHALQAGIEVVGLVEALPECGGYRVHRDKLVRLGVPILESHTVVSANGSESVESITITEVDTHFQIIQGTQKTFACDTILIAVGLSPIDEFYQKAMAYGIPAYIAGDAEEIAEASAAIFSGKITGRQIVTAYIGNKVAIPDDWYITSERLRSKPGRTYPLYDVDIRDGVFPVIHCRQEIPCDPCVGLCSKNLIQLTGPDILSVPKFISPDASCIGCGQCVIGCPGLAITLVDSRKDTDFPTVTIPYEFERESLHPGDRVVVTDAGGAVLGVTNVIKVLSNSRNNHTNLIQVKAPRDDAAKIAGVQVIDPSSTPHLDPMDNRRDDDEIICRCERVTINAIREKICQGYTDLNEIKAITRAGMGACGSKTCNPLIMKLLSEAGIGKDKITDGTIRPLFIEIPLGKFAPDHMGDLDA